MKHIYVFLFIIAMQKGFLIASWRVSVGVELHDTQLQNVSVGVQMSNALTKKLYADALFFKLCYDRQTGIYGDAVLDGHKGKKSKKHTSFDYAARCFSLALIKEATFCLKECYKEVMQKSPAGINISPTNRYTRAAIPFESITNHVINGYVAGILPDNYVKELYAEVQKALTCAKSEQQKGLSEVNNFGRHGKKLVMINGTLSFYDDMQELSKKIDTLEKLAKKLKALC